MTPLGAASQLYQNDDAGKDYGNGFKKGLGPENTARMRTIHNPEKIEALEKAGIICNYNGVPNDPRPPRATSGICDATVCVNRSLKLSA